MAASVGNGRRVNEHVDNKITETKLRNRSVQKEVNNAVGIDTSVENVNYSDIKTVSDKKSAGFMQRILPEWIYEPEYMMQGKEKDPDRIHRHADSYFSTSSGFTNYRGLLNLCLILLVLSNARLVLENIIKYGILANPVDWLHLFAQQPDSWPNLFLILSVNIFVLVAFCLEVFFTKGLLSEKLGSIFQAVNVALLLLFPAVVIYILHPNPIFSVFSLGSISVVFLKLVSYACVNKWCRDQLKEDSKKHSRRRKSTSEHGEKKTVSNGVVNDILVKYPNNLNLSDLYYFIFAPTLTYELNFPRSTRIRKRFLVKRFAEMIFLSQLMMALTQQWMIPTINNAMKPLEELAVYRVVERLLKLAIPNHFIWLIFFYWFFHSTLNVVAEILRFGDREFYRDWWNAETVSRFWQDWNVPVHRWASRHLYKPLMRCGYSKLTSSIVVFFLSAFFHEYLLSVPLRMFKIWAFSAMIGQIPLAYLTARYSCLRGKMGNIIMWLSLIMGQPIAILAYVHDYYIINFGTLHNQTISI